MPNLPTNTASEAMRIALETLKLIANLPSSRGDDLAAAAREAVTEIESLYTAAAPGEEKCRRCNGCGSIRPHGNACPDCDGFGKVSRPQLAGEEAVAAANEHLIVETDEPLTAHDHQRIEQTWQKHFVCDLPPAGWTCSRLKGHEGPCAASPTPSLAGQTHSASEQKRADPNCNFCGGTGRYMATEHTTGSDPIGSHEMEFEICECWTDMVPSQTHSAPGGDEARDAERWQFVSRGEEGSRYVLFDTWSGHSFFNDRADQTIDAAIAKDSST